MDEYKYWNALNRDDLTQWLVHFTKGQNNQPFFNLRNILKIGKVFASKAKYITCYYPEGAACFYEVPPQNWPRLINTNPNERKGFGLIVSKVVFWYLGGRPAIYTENPTAEWPIKEKFRLIKTELARVPKPLDWTHEREWRFPGDLIIYQSIPYTWWWPWTNTERPFEWWWPCVEKRKDAYIIFNEHKNVETIYVIELGKVLERKNLTQDNELEFSCRVADTKS